MGRGQQPLQRADPAEQRVHIARVGHVVAVVDHRGDGDRVEPDPVHAQLIEMVQVRDEPVEIAHPVPVAVGERAGIDLVEHRAAPPVVGSHRQNGELTIASAAISR